MAGTDQPGQICAAQASKATAKRAGWRLPAAWAAVLLPWLGLLEVLHRQHWGRGPVVFVAMVGLAALGWIAPRFMSRVASRPGPGWLTMVAVGLVLLASLSTARRLANLLAEEESERPLVDIGANTFAAAHWLMDGENPYVHPAQLGGRVDRAPGATRSPDGKLLLWGLRYDYGYPYFPVMFLAYLPFLALPFGMHGIRLGNAVLTALTCIAMVRLLAALRAPQGPAPGKSRGGPPLDPVPWLAVLAYLAWHGLGEQLFTLGVTDGVIACLGISAYWALARGRATTAGVLLGLAQAAKLLPGPLLMLPAFLWLLRGDRRGAVRMATSYAAAALMFIVPFVLLDPPGFISSTVLFYLSLHGGGDSTSLWYFLPQVLRTPFLLVGWGLALGVVGLGWRRRRTFGAVPAAAFSSYVLLIAFSPMSHLNYLVAVLPLGAVALSAGALAEPAGALLPAERRQPER